MQDRKKLLDLFERFDERLAEVRQIGRRAACDDILRDDYRLVNPFRSGENHIVFDALVGSGANAFQNTRRYKDAAAPEP